MNRMRYVMSILAATFVASGQSTSPQAGYRLSEPIDVAPGQLVMITVPVPNTSAALVPSTVSIPETELGGFRATVRQPRFSPSIVRFIGMKPQPCPVVQPNCSSVPVSFTVVMPLEMIPDIDATLVFSDRGQDLAPIPLRAMTDKIHVMNTCDELPVSIGIAVEAAGRCLPVVQRQDGRLVTRDNPARPGDVLAAWAYGLGFPGASGSPTNTGPVSIPVPPELFFTYRSELPGLSLAQSPSQRPLYAGARGTSGQYQINFEVPALPAGATLPSCDDTFDYNMNLRVRGQSSSDTIHLCVQQ